MKRGQMGFTLIELIVVIAILGILAGIAIPVYSGYIKKANKAADLTLLDAVNTAVAAARTENGVTLHNASLDVNDKKITGLSTSTDGVAESFEKYFAGNTGTALKYFEESDDFTFDPATQNFYATEDGVMTYEIGGGSYVASRADVSKVLASAYGDAEVFTSEQIVGEVDNVVDYALNQIGAGNTASRLLDSINGDPDFQKFYAELTEGVEISDSDKDLAALNALVLYSAGKAKDLNADAIYRELTGSTNGRIQKSGDSANQIAQYVMEYGLGLAYAKSEGLEINGVTDVFDKISERTRTQDPETGDWIDADKTNFQLWLEQHPQEVDGYLSALGMVSDNAFNINASELMSGNFTDTELAGVIDGILGRSTETNGN